jgi:hypothetical protein
MPLLDRMKLKKLTIKSFKKKARSGVPFGTFEAMYNPTSFSQKYEIEYSKPQSTGSSGKTNYYTRSRPKTLQIKLILDETGVQDMGISTLGPQKKVADLVKKFVDLTFRVNGDTHEPSYLVAEWGGKDDGGLIFSCRLESVDISYVSFNRDGSPQRAELDVVLVGDEDVKRRVAKENKSSPDLTHSRVVKSGDTLPLLCKEIYGTSQYYLRVAAVNNLDDFRNLMPGQELIFPPLSE